MERKKLLHEKLFIFPDRHSMKRIYRIIVMLYLDRDKDECILSVCLVANKINLSYDIWWHFKSSYMRDRFEEVTFDENIWKRVFFFNHIQMKIKTICFERTFEHIIDENINNSILLIWIKENYKHLKKTNIVKIGSVQHLILSVNHRFCHLVLMFFQSINYKVHASIDGQYYIIHRLKPFGTGLSWYWLCTQPYSHHM